MSTFDLLSQCKRINHGGIYFGYGAGKEIELIIEINKDTITFIRKYEDIISGRNRELYEYI